MRRAARAALALAALALATPRAAAAAQGPIVPVADTRPAGAEHFVLTDEVRQALRSLWEASMAAHEERVACLGGYNADGVAHITRVRTLTAASADSLNVSAKASIHDCAPPNWTGTVHTHIALRDGQPYILFSGADRGVMFLWRREHRSQGVFCILYSSWQANCEAGFEAAAILQYAGRPGEHAIP
ncbi:MAG TPA: hypothetical protein VNA89_03395 [Gemmatimonadaceae bacterium]|nr:hypothetical protein [Gemmatimonadaceae bacterium]